MFRKGQGGATSISQTSFELVAKILANALGEAPLHPASMMAKIEQIMQPTQNEVYFTGLPIFVEGIEDIAFLSSYLVATNRWAEFRRLGCHFIIGGGKSNLSRLVAIATSLQIPFYLVFDSDGNKQENRSQHERDNKVLRTLNGNSEASPFPDSNEHLDSHTIWKTNIGIEAADSFGKAAWDTATETVKKEKNFHAHVEKKNTLLISGVIEKLYSEGTVCDALEQTCVKILNRGKAAALR